MLRSVTVFPIIFLLIYMHYNKNEWYKHFKIPSKVNEYVWRNRLVPVVLFHPAANDSYSCGVSLLPNYLLNNLCCSIFFDYHVFFVFLQITDDQLKSMLNDIASHSKKTTEVKVWK